MNWWYNYICESEFGCDVERIIETWKEIRVIWREEYLELTTGLEEPEERSGIQFQNYSGGYWKFNVLLGERWGSSLVP